MKNDVKDWKLLLFGFAVFVVLALFSALGMRDLDEMNGLKAALSVVLSAVSVLTFAIAGVIYWSEVSVMM